jgi:hypothetical protein
MTFSVEDMISARAVTDREIMVEITFEVKFVKSTMFKFAIEGATVREMTKWLKDYFQVVKKHCLARSMPIISHPISRQPSFVRPGMARYHCCVHYLCLLAGFKCFT